MHRLLSYDPSCGEMIFEHYGAAPAGVTPVLLVLPPSLYEHVTDVHTILFGVEISEYDPTPGDFYNIIEFKGETYGGEEKIEHSLRPSASTDSATGTDTGAATSKRKSK